MYLTCTDPMFCLFFFKFCHSQMQISEMEKSKRARAKLDRETAENKHVTFGDEKREKRSIYVAGKDPRESRIQINLAHIPF